VTTLRQVGLWRVDLGDAGPIFDRGQLVIRRRREKIEETIATFLREKMDETI